jgi:hypothetical protein
MPCTFIFENLSNPAFQARMRDVQKEPALGRQEHLNRTDAEEDEGALEGMYFGEY